MQPFLEPTEAIESDHPDILRLAKRITGDAADDHDRAAGLFAYVRDQVAYSVNNPFSRLEHYRATAVLDRRSGFCVHKAVVLCALARACGIPARLVFADIRNHRIPEPLLQAMGTDLFVYHCYTDLHLGGTWLQATPSFDRKLCAEHGFPLVEFDGRESAILAPLDLAGRPFVEYVRNHGTFADLPLERILESWDETYGKDRVVIWARMYESGVVPGGGLG